MRWSILNKDQAEGKVKIPSTPTTAFVQYTTEELDQLDQPQCSHRKGQMSEQYLTVPPLDKQDQFPTQTDEGDNPSNTIYSKYNGDFSCHGKAKNKIHAD